MIPREDLPDDAADWSGVDVVLARLADDSAASCPVSPDNLFEYIQVESGDIDAADRARLRFVRTAKVSNARYWLWQYTESDGEKCFVTCREDQDGATTLGFSSPNGLSEEQYLLAEYYDEIYWS